MDELPTPPPNDFIIKPPDTTAVPPKSSKSKYLIIVSLIMVAAVAGIYVYMVNLSRPATVSVSRPVTSPAATPTPEKVLSQIATQSAFLALDAHVASLSADINNFILEDPALNPPTLELPLGF